jgi:GT2 family glycosyltransferase
MIRARPRISIVIPAFNVAATLPLTLSCLEAQSIDRSQFECIFVDDCSTDETAAIIENWQTSLSVVLIRNERNRGRSATRNRGLGHARGDLVVFLDGDMFVSPFWLAAYAQRFAAGDVEVLSGRRWSLNLATPDNGSRGILDGALTAAAGHSDPASIFDSLRNRSTLGQGPSVLKERLEREIELVCRAFPSALTRALAFITSNVAVCRITLDRTDGFSPWLERGEDTELGLRLARLGARFSYVPEAEAVHPFTIDGEAGGAPSGMLASILIRHPFVAVLLWYVWASSIPPDGELGANPGRADWSSLVDIASAESSRGTAGLDARALLNGGSFGPLPFRFELGRQDLVAHLSHWCAASEVWLGELLDAAVREGMLVGRRGSEILFDFTLTRNWLEQHTTLRQHMFLHSFARSHKTARQHNPTADAAVVTWSGRYEVLIPSDALPLNPSDVGVVLPLPTSTHLQSQLVFGERWPHNLMDHSRHDLLFGVPIINAPEVDGIRRVGYTFRCVVHEWERPRDLPSDDVTRAAWLRPAFPSNQLRRCNALLGEIAPGKRSSPEERARKIYQWLLEHTSYSLNELPDHATATTGLGHCVQLVRLFVELCRLSGIPAREACGAIAGRSVAHTVNTTSVTGYFSPFAHTWAEFRTEAGWIPVELIAVEHNERVATHRTFPDAELRDAFIADARCYERYYFGQLDPYRIHSTNWANQLPTLVRPLKGRWVGIADRRLRVRHELTLTRDEGDQGSREDPPRA